VYKFWEMSEFYIMVPWNNYCLRLQEDMFLTSILICLQVLNVVLNFIQLNCIEINLVND